MYIWSNEYSVGDAIIDGQHKHMFDIIRDIYDHIIKNDSKDNVITPLFISLIKYTNDHFMEEIRFLLNKDVEKDVIIDHMNEHHIIVNNLIDIIHSYLLSNNNVIVDIALLVNQWIGDHIINYDIVTFKKIKKDLDI